MMEEVGEVCCRSLSSALLLLLLHAHYTAWRSSVLSIRCRASTPWHDCPRTLTGLVCIYSRMWKVLTLHCKVPRLKTLPARPQEDIACEVCSKSADGAHMLLCNGCDLGFHTRCLDPPLHGAVPAATWHCPDCAGNNGEEDAAVVLHRKRHKADPGAAQARSCATLRSQNNLQFNRETSVIDLSGR